MERINKKNVAKFVVELDKEKLCEFPSCEDAGIYDPVVDKIFEEAMKIDSIGVDQLSFIISESFNIIYDENYRAGAFKITAKQILGLTDMRICPVCKKYYFKNGNSGSICKNCSWIFDETQNEDPAYMDGLNDLSLREHQLEYYLKNNESASEEYNVIHNEYFDKFDALFRSIEESGSYSSPMAGVIYSQMQTLQRIYARNLVELYVRSCMKAVDMKQAISEVEAHMYG